MHDKRVFLSINIPPMSLDLVIIPTYNEIENVEAIIRAVVDLGQGYHILIVDDNSPDRTADKVRELQAEFNGNLHLEVRKEKSGLGTAYIHGFKWALQNNYDFIFEMDADFSHTPADLISCSLSTVQFRQYPPFSIKFLSFLVFLTFLQLGFLHLDFYSK